MQHLEVSCAVQRMYTSLGAKGLTEVVHMDKHANVTIIILLHMYSPVLVPSNKNHFKCALANIDRTQVTISANIVADFNGCKHCVCTQGMTLVYLCTDPRSRLCVYLQTVIYVYIHTYPKPSVLFALYVYWQQWCKSVMNVKHGNLILVDHILCFVTLATVT